MINENNIFRKILFILVIVLLTTPLICTFIPETKGELLYGKEKSDISLNFFTGSQFFHSQFQDKAEAISKQSVGFANNWVRLNNEINFRLFRYVYVDKLVLGKEDFFYEEIYITEYLGRNFIGDFFIEKKIKALKQLQILLKNKHNIELLLILEPGKAYFSPKQIPDRYHPEIKTASNFNRFLYYCKKEGVNYLDLNNYFKENKTTSPHLLYSKYGVHWSSYGMWQAVFQINNFIEERSLINLPDIIQVGDSVSTVNKDLDFDLEPPMNLIWELPHETMNFPVIKIEDGTQFHKPAVLTIADSYYWSIWNSGINQALFSKNDYWYYNKTIYPYIWDPAVSVIDSTRKENILQNEIILLMTTDANLYNFGWDFIEQTLALFDENYKTDYHLLFLNQLMNEHEQYKAMLQESIRKQTPFSEILYKKVNDLIIQHNNKREKQ